MQELELNRVQERVLRALSAAMSHDGGEAPVQLDRTGVREAWLASKSAFKGNGGGDRFNAVVASLMAAGKVEVGAPPSLRA